MMIYTLSMDLNVLYVIQYGKPRKEMKKTIQERITEIVVVTQGIKGVELGARLATERLDLTIDQILIAVQDLVDTGELVEIEYNLPEMNYRTKSFYLPKGTEVRCLQNT